MKFGLMYEIPVQRPWHARSEYEAFQRVIDEAVLADELGFHSFWTVEHHFLAEFSHCSAPEVLYGALATKTRNIRIGHGVRLMPFPYNHPVRTAESAATVDLLSNGRLEFGTGRSVSGIELEGFGIDPGETRSMWEEALQVVVRAWADEKLHWQGKHFQIPEREVVPKPLQRPHPPLWGATGSPDGHEMMGRMGLGLLSFTLGVSLDDLARRIESYRHGLTHADPIGRFVNGQAGTFTMVHCAETAEEAIQNAARPFEAYLAESLKLVASVADLLNGKELGTYGYTLGAKQANEAGVLDQLDLRELMRMNSVVVGNPDDCIRMAKQYEQAGCDLLLCMVQPSFVDPDKVRRCIELLGTEVLPAFRED
jgi:alkanesulfonate monooxygenase SsuD/methylene tetrahydromethanopterin reductase-like flavin-dependent oxidoreductase (luciferase family)